MTLDVEWRFRSLHDILWTAPVRDSNLSANNSIPLRFPFFEERRPHLQNSVQASLVLDLPLLFYFVLVFSREHQNAG